MSVPSNASPWHAGILGADKWADRYARSQARMEQAAAISDREWAGRELSTISSRVRRTSGDELRIRLVTPEEPIDHGFAHGVVGWITAVFLRGDWVRQGRFAGANGQWVVVVERPGSWFRRDEVVCRWFVADGRTAQRLRSELRAFIEAGGEPNAFDPWGALSPPS